MDMQVLRTLLIIFLAVVLPLILFIIYFKLSIYIKEPKPENIEVLEMNVEKKSENVYVFENNWLRQSESGLWEMYIEGEAFERGVANGKMANHLIHKQEDAFIAEIRKMIPSRFYLSFLRYFVGWFNRNITDHIPYEYQLEILGISKSASEEFDYVGPSYLRFLNYHAAHDIGHSLINMGMVVGCTSFAAWDEASEDGNLIVGRNFDFYVGDDFAEEKIVAFCKPEKGYGFMYVTWGGMIGVVSGMNEKGLTVTINSAPSGMPLASKTPVSIVAREVLQYAGNIEEAFEIINKRETFVAESFLIGSAFDNKAVIIEKSTKTTRILNPVSNTIVCANHYQCDDFQNDKHNVKAVQTSASPYRQKRVMELIDELMPFNHFKAASLLRDKQGLGGENIGFGNEKAVNQLISHHSVIFMPSELIMWVSTNPYQLGKYVAYDLKKILNLNPENIDANEIYETALIIPQDLFLNSSEYAAFVEYNKQKQILQKEKKYKSCEKFKDSDIESFVNLNPDLFSPWAIAGDYYKACGLFDKAIHYYNIALTKEIATENERSNIQKNRDKCLKKKRG